jgi:tetratricopeptide (TPR) repeat protein/DNA-binding PadR family transcriptional regulator
MGSSRKNPPLLILAILAKGPKHGHALRREIQAIYGVLLGAGALYGAISRLEERGLIAALPTENRRRPYRITDTGLEFLHAQLSTIRQLAEADGAAGSSSVKGLGVRIPTFYQVENAVDLNDEIDNNVTRISDRNADELPFGQLGGRRFELMTYLIKKEESPNAVVTLVKASGDQGRDVLVHEGGLLRVVVQCKNLDHKFSLPELLEEVLKFVLHNYRERYIPSSGIVYELWAPKGLTGPADNLVANWPHNIPEKEVRQAFDSVIRSYKTLASLAWEDVHQYVVDTLSQLIRLQRHEGFALSHKARSCPGVFARFFEGSVVMKREHVDKYFDTALSSRINSAQNPLAEKLADITDRIEGDSIDAEINEARDLVNAHKFADAAVILRRLQSKKQHSLTKHQRYRVISNLGAIAFGEGRNEEAARHFFEAVLLEPDDERARINEVFGHFLRRDFEKTFKMATERRKSYPLSGRLASMWVTTAPREVQLAELVGALDQALFNDPEVCVALARRAMMTNQLEEARDYARSGVIGAPKWSQPKLVLAQIAIGELAMENAGLNVLQPAQRTSIVQNGIADATQAVELSEADGGWAKAESLVARSELQLLAGDVAKATEDARKAYGLDRENVNVLVGLAQCHLVVGALDRAIEILEEAHAKEARADVSHMYAKALTDRAKGGDLQRAVDIAVAVDIAPLPKLMRAAFAIVTLQCIGKKNDWQEAERYYEKVLPLLDEATAKALHGFIQHRCGDVQGANLSATEAAALVNDRTEAITKEFLARLFTHLGRHADALPLYEELFEKRVPSFDVGRFIACVARLHLDRKVIDICDELHRRRGVEWGLLEFEVQYLELYDKQKAIQRLQDFLRINPGHKLAQLRLSVIGYLSRRPELIRAAMKELPTVDELPVEYLGPTLGIMRYGEDNDLLIDYAYRYLRGHFDRQEAHEAYIQAVITTADRQFPPELDVVGQNSAVLCEEVPNGELRWFVLEDTDKPLRDFEEISPNDPIAIELMGKRVGDTFVLARASLSNRQAQVKRIIPKYVRRFQDCMNELQVRFGPTAMLQSVHVGPESSLAQPGLVSVMASVQERARQVGLIQSWYAQEPMSLHLYGSRFGKNAYVALQHLAQTDGMAVKCFDGNAAEAEKAMSILRERPTVVVDLSAISTVRLLGLEWIFGTKLFPFIATEGTWEELQDTFREIVPRREKGGTMSYEDGKFLFQEEDPETAARRKEEDQAFLDSFHKNVEIVPAMELAAVEPRTRELLVDYLGRYGAETVVLGARPQVIMWCDDAPQSQLSGPLFGTRRAWTQLILLSLTEAGILQHSDYVKAVAKMIGMGFTSTYFDAKCVLECAKLAEYRTVRFPLKQMVEVFQNATSPAKDLVRQFLEFFVLLQQDTVLPPQKALIVRAFLDALWRNASTHGMVLALRSLSTKLFGLNVVAEAEFNAYFDAWFSSLSRPIV